jgi:2-keto-3-deoxy-galactonokinase
MSQEKSTINMNNTSRSASQRIILSGRAGEGLGWLEELYMYKPCSLAGLGIAERALNDPRNLTSTNCDTSKTA